MSRYIRMANQSQQECVKILSSLTGKYSTWQVWNDFITMTACSLANIIPNPKSEEREKMYLDIAKKYTDKEQELISSLYAQIIIGLDADPEQDFLGELFMQLDMGNDWKGQFFTPYNVCEMMSKMSARNIKAQIKEHGFIGVNDPACGAGALLVAFANECRRQDVNYQTSVLFTAQDIDQLAGLMCYIQLSLLGCAGYVTIGDTLANPCRVKDDKGLIPSDDQNVWFTPFYYRNEWQARVLLANLRRFSPKPEVEQVEPEPPEPQPKPEPIPEPEPKYCMDRTGQLLLF